MAVNFDKDPAAVGLLRPMRFEGDIQDCEIEGTIPSDIRGTLYRSCLDRRYPAMYPNDTPYNADGAVDMFRIANGTADFRCRYVRTERFKAESAARRALFGLYRNRYTSDPSVRHLSHNTANTTPIVYAGKLFSMKEDSPPTAMDPHTLETIGEWTFDGKMTAKTFTAHPKIDPLSGEMFGFSYEARGDATPDLAVYAFDKHGQVTREIWFRSPVVSMMHDMAITSTHIILPTTAMTTSLERLRSGQLHWAYDPGMPTYVAVIPRDGEARDVRWFKGTRDQHMLIHATNARTEGNRIILDAPVAAANFHAYFPNLDGSSDNPAGRAPSIRRWTFDLASSDETWQEEILFDGFRGTSLVRMDDRFLTQRFRYSFMPVNDPSLATTDAPGRNVPSHMANAWYRFDHDRNVIDARFYAGDTYTLSEPQFIPRRSDAPEGDGYLIGAATNLIDMLSQIVIFDAQRPKEGPIARIRLPFRLHTQVHSWWASASELPFD